MLALLQADRISAIDARLLKLAEAAPVTLEEEERQLAELQSQVDAAVALDAANRGNPYHFSQHDAIISLKKRMRTLENSIRARRGLAGRAVA